MAETIQTGMTQSIKLPGVIDPNALDRADLEVIWMEMLKSVTKR
jgi:hypothetical protein